MNEDSQRAETIESSRRRLLRALGVVGTVGVAGCGGRSDTGTASPTATPSATASPTAENTPTEPAGTEPDPTVIWVGPDGVEEGVGSRSEPMASVGRALKHRAEPGDTIRVKPGTYRERIETGRAGEPDAPITLTGPPEAILRPPSGTFAGVNVNHSHVHITGLTIDGLTDPSAKFDRVDAWVGVALDVNPFGRDADEFPDYLTGLVLEPHRIGGSQNALIHPRRIRNSTIGNFELHRPAGMANDSRVTGYEEGHNREVVYMGSSPGNVSKDWYPFDGLDRSRGVRIHHIDNSAGKPHSELVDVKAGCTDVTVEYCTDRNAGVTAQATTTGAISLKGNECVARWNDVGDCTYPVNFDPWVPIGEDENWANDNAVYGNYFHEFTEGAFGFDRGASPDDQRVFCGNRIEDGPGDYAFATGSCGEDVPTGNGVGHDEA